MAYLERRYLQIASKKLRNIYVQFELEWFFKKQRKR